MSSVRWAAVSAVAGFCSLGMLAAGAIHLYMQPAQPPQWTPGQAALGQSATSAPRLSPSLPALPAHRAGSDAAYYDQLRKQLVWVRMRFGKETLVTPDHGSRMLLAKSAAERAGLSEVGLSFQDVYGIINAETSWVPRRGASKDGTPNVGIAQFEPATARALGVRDAEDPVEAIHAAAQHMKEAAQWSRDRLHRLKLGKEAREQKLREGVSVYYNLSSRGRNRWNGLNTAKLPVETQRHILNARLGAQEAAVLDAQLQAAELQAAVYGRRGVLTAGNTSFGS